MLVAMGQDFARLNRLFLRRSLAHVGANNRETDTDRGNRSDPGRRTAVQPQGPLPAQAGKSPVCPLQGPLTAGGAKSDRPSRVAAALHPNAHRLYFQIKFGQ